jgi:hypothetical protein
MADDGFYSTLFTQTLHMLFGIVGPKSEQPERLAQTRDLALGLCALQCGMVMETFYEHTKEHHELIKANDNEFITHLEKLDFFKGLDLRAAYDKSTQEEQRYIWCMIGVLYFLAMTSGDVTRAVGGIFGKVMSNIGLPNNMMRLPNGKLPEELMQNMSAMESKITDFLPVLQGMAANGGVQGGDGDPMGMIGSLLSGLGGPPPPSGPTASLTQITEGGGGGDGEDGAATPSDPFSSLF